MKHFKIIGRIPCHENVVFSCEAVSVSSAVKQFREGLHEGLSKEEVQNIEETEGSTFYIDHIFESASPITRRERDYQPGPPPP